MTKKQIEPYLFSVIGVGAMFLLLVAVYLIGGVAKARVDLTEEKLYTLSAGTKAILSKLDTPLQIRFYCSQGAKEMPVTFKSFARRVEDLLGEYEKAGQGNIEVKKFDPEPDSDAEDSANLDGIEGQIINLGDKIYLGLAVSMLDAKATIPVLSPEREKLLEYDISRAITRVVSKEKPVVGVMSPLPMFGEFNPMMMRMGQMQRQDPWVLISELRRDFEVKQVETSVEEIPSEVKVLLLVHPKGLSDKTQFAIDQFVLRGGKLMVFVDPLSIVDSRNSPQQNPLQASATAGSSLDKLFKAWGIEFDQNKVVADMNFKTRINRQGRAEATPTVLSMTEKGVNTDDVVTGQIDSLLLPFAGTFSGTPAEGLKQTVLVKTTTSSQQVERFMAEFSGEQMDKDFNASGKEMPIAIRLTGKFKTAFPDGKPKETAGDKPEEKKEEKKEEETGSGLKESKSEGVVVAFGDTDLIYDQFTVEVQNFFNQRVVIPRNANLILVQNIVEQLAGDSNLIGVRSRATLNRPFTKVRDLQTQAESRWRDKIKKLEQNLADTQTRLNELQQKKEGGQRFILSPEQQAELAKFKQKQTEVNKELKQVRKDLRRDIDWLETRLKWVNIAGMPLLVTVLGISLAVVKRKKTAAK